MDPSRDISQRLRIQLLFECFGQDLPNKLVCFFAGLFADIRPAPIESSQVMSIMSRQNL
jgi:hypothetical protein